MSQWELPDLFDPTLQTPVQQRGSFENTLISHCNPAACQEYNVLINSLAYDLGTYVFGFPARNIVRMEDK